jgi:dimethylhistidine N-methyltransferase
MPSMLARASIQAGEEFLSDVLEGLAARVRSVPSKYLYDAHGSELFERICELEEYYPTRVELGIMRDNAASIARAIGPRARIVELGSGSARKTRRLLEALEEPVAYIPVDISRSALFDAAAAMARALPSVRVSPLHADFSRPFSLPDDVPDDCRTVIYFPGSTIGNLTGEDAASLLQSMRRVCGPRGAFLVGADLVKDPRVLHAAYNDSQGLTATFNLNLLERMNRELGADFRVERFEHHAPFDAEHSRIEMRLVSRTPQRVSVAGHRFLFQEGEPLVTEHSQKYTLSEIAHLAAGSFVLEHTWTDAAQYFSVQYLRAV